MNTLPDPLRACLGRLLVWLVKCFKLADLPDSDTLARDQSAEVAERIQAAMDALDARGQRGGWRAGLAVLAEARAPGAALFTTPPWLLVTLFMGLPGSRTPATARAAEALVAQLQKQYRETGHPDYLLTTAVETAAAQLREADLRGGRWTAGILQAMFDARSGVGSQFASRARELVVLTVFKQTPEYRKFLAVDPDGSVSLPRGTSYESFAAAMLSNAYGPYPS